MSKKFEKNLPFKVNELIKKNGIASAKIVDAELDIFECSFDSTPNFKLFLVLFVIPLLMNAFCVYLL